jgi:hypothetical protein
MSQSTITAEGGTITLSTAPDGEITASSADFAVYVVQQVEGGGTGVTEYDTVAELIAASLVPGFEVGYYEVAGVWITYWDGAVFVPPFLENPENEVNQFLDFHWAPSGLDSYAIDDPIDSWVDSIQGVAMTAAGTERPLKKSNTGKSTVKGDGVDDFLVTFDADVVAIANTATNTKTAMWIVGYSNAASFEYVQNFANSGGTQWLSVLQQPTNANISTAKNSDGTTFGAGSVTQPFFAMLFLVVGNQARMYAKWPTNVPLLVATNTISGTNLRTFDRYSVCGWPLSGLKARSVVFGHGLAAGDKAQALYDDPADFFDALGRLYGI